MRHHACNLVSNTSARKNTTLYVVSILVSSACQVATSAVRCIKSCGHVASDIRRTSLFSPILLPAYCFVKSIHCNHNTYGATAVEDDEGRRHVKWQLLRTYRDILLHVAWMKQAPFSSRFMETLPILCMYHINRFAALSKKRKLCDLGTCPPLFVMEQRMSRLHTSGGLDPSELEFSPVVEPTSVEDADDVCMMLPPVQLRVRQPLIPLVNLTAMPLLFGSPGFAPISNALPIDDDGLFVEGDVAQRSATVPNSGSASPTFCISPRGNSPVDKFLVELGSLLYMSDSLYGTCDVQEKS